MNKLQTIAMGAALSAVAVISLAAPAFAATDTTDADKCYLVVTHLSTITNNMHDISDKREDAYQDAAARVTKQLKAAQNAGYDTTQLQADYKMLNSDMEQFHTDRQTLEADLTNALSASQTECGSGSGQLADALQAARAALTTLRADDVKTRVDIRQKLIPDVRAYVAWLKDKATPGVSTN